MWRLGHLTTAAGEADARYPLIIRGIALGFLFTPINNVAYANLKPSEAQEASGLINLSRQLGGSFGIAIITTYLQSRTALHRAGLVANTYAANPAFIERFQAALSHFMALGYSYVKAQAAAYAAIDQALTGQALMLSYNDSWMLILKSFLITAPAILVIRKPRGRRRSRHQTPLAPLGEPSAGHHESRPQPAAPTCRTPDEGARCHAYASRRRPSAQWPAPQTARRPARELAVPSQARWRCKQGSIDAYRSSFLV